MAPRFESCVRADETLLDLSDKFCGWMYMRTFECGLLGIDGCDCHFWCMGWEL